MEDLRHLFVLQALKGDIIRSILSRIQLLCEEAEVNNLYQGKKFFYRYL